MTPDPDPTERRQHHRADVELSVTQLLGNVLTGRSGFTTRTLNLSEGGAKLRVPEEMLLGEPLALVLHLPDGVAYPCRVRVVRSSPYPDDPGEDGAWAAVEFVELPDATRAAIRALVTREQAG